MTSSNGNIFRVTGPLCGEFTGPGEFPTQRPVMRSFDVFLDMRLNKRLSKQWRGWWFETSLWSLWRQCNGIPRHIRVVYDLSCVIVAWCWFYLYILQLYITTRRGNQNIFSMPLNQPWRIRVNIPICIRQIPHDAAFCSQNVHISVTK